ncbi:MAG: 2-C-methyl-D-erythritol 2,4-cyclodiphosphate synthase [Bacteroidota bacterium]|jgi:2-C-methyl-D-erythritol 2,4-cyclodiphosphate synthase|nr:2-C-methyl-D-erythritol 2,4-cyclodiphosphate synthase [Bacteroidota bacterium]
MKQRPRIGLGYDVHRLADGETLVLGGVTVSENFGTVAHSDGDVLLHAICDALLGAVALGDIGEHFPDSDAAYRGISSIELLRRCVALVGDAGFAIGNIDATLILERPKILPFKQEMRARIADAAGIPLDGISIKATTAERMGFVGRGEGVEAHATALVFPRD